MKKQLRLVLLLFFIPLFTFSQNVYEWYQDGIVIFQLKTSSSYTIPSKDKMVDLKKVDFLATLQTRYGIYEAKQLHPNDRDELLKKTYQIKFTEVEKIETLIRELAKNPVIEYAEKKELHRHFLTPNDLGANSTTGTGMWHLHKMQAQQAWDLSTGNSNVIVAVTDDAILTSHQDLTNKLVQGHDATTGGNDPNPCGANDGNHGTHVSGTIGAETNNNLGVSSIGYNVSVMPVRIGDCSTGALTAGYEGINWAANNGADVINMSWGGGGYSNYGQNICNAAFNAGAILVAAAGNDGTSQQFYPAAYNNVIAVASTTINDTKSDFSQYGTWITVSSPGSSIRSTWASSNSAYARIDGTSMASPNVSGLVGLMKSHAPSATNQDIINCLLSSADDISSVNPSYNGQLGSGRINAYEALLCLAQYNVDTDAGISEVVSPGATICGGSFTPQVVLRNFGADNLTSVTITYSWNGSPQTYNWTGNLATGQSQTITLPVQTGAAGNYTFTASTSNPNSTTDENTANDSFSSSFSMDPNGQMVDFTIQTDCYGEEVTWQILDNSNNVILSGGPYTNSATGTTENLSLCLPVGCYTFEIADSYGDGMNGSAYQGCSIDGDYYMTDENGGTLFQMTAANSNFGSSTSHPFCIIAPDNFNDAGITSILSPSGSICTNSITPQVELQNFGLNALTSVVINYQTTGGVQTYNWSGNLATNQSTTITLPAISVNAGSINLVAYTSNPNGTTDDNTANDQSSTNLVVYSGTGQSLPFVESFENNPFSNGVWTLENPDNATTWEIATITGTTPGNQAAKMDFYNYAQSSRRDGMISPKLNFAGYSSIDMTFEHAYRRYNQTATDSLIIYISTDCGASYQRIFARGEDGTGSFATATTTSTNFTPASSDEWCMGTVGSSCYSINLDAYIGEQVLIKFEGFNAGTVGNNLFVDNINISGVPNGTSPTPSFTQNSQSVCEGQSVTFTDQSTANITAWNWSFPGGTPATSTSANPTVTYGTPGTYDVTLEVTNAFGTESITTSNHITVNATPSVSITTPSATICNGSSANLTASGAASYSWDNGLGNGTSHTVSPSSTTTYTVTGTSAQGCTATDAITITVTSAPVLSVNATELTICSGESTTLSVSGAGNYSWNNGLGNGASHIVSPSSTTTYEVTGTQGSCSTTESITITVTNPAPLNVSSGSMTICEGSSTTLTAAGGANYSWSPSGSLNTSTGSSVVASPTTSTTYTVVDNSANSCAQPGTITITVTPAPQVNVSTSSTSVCAGASATLNATGANSYSWDNGLGIGATQTVSPSNTTTYTVTGTTDGCSSTSSITITVTQGSSLQVSASENSICEGESTTISVNGGSNYSWTPGSNLNTTTGNVVVATPSSTTTYTVQGTSSCGTETATITIQVNANPSAPFITQTGNTLYTSVPAGASAQWYLNGNPVPNGSGASLVITESGTYHVVITSNAGCSTSSLDFNATLDTSGLGENDSNGEFSVFPNPTQNKFSVVFPANAGVTAIQLFDMLGKEIPMHSGNEPTSGTIMVYDLTDFAEGVYLLRVQSSSGNKTTKIIKQK